MRESLGGGMNSRRLSLEKSDGKGRARHSLSSLIPSHGPDHTHSEKPLTTSSALGYFPELMRRLFLINLFLLVAALPKGRGITPQETEFFEKNIRPVLAEQCYKCHGPEKQKGAL